MTDRLCPVSGAVLTQDRYIAPAGVAELRRALDDLPGTIHDLEDAIGRGQYRFTDRGAPARSAVIPLPYNARAADAHRALTRLLVRWAVAVWETDLGARQGGLGSLERGPFHTWRAVGRYLATTGCRVLPAHPDGPRAALEIIDGIRRARAVVDRPPDRVYAGPCGARYLTLEGTAVCDAELYARPGAPDVECRRCGARHDVTSRRDAMLARVAELELPAVDLARTLTALTGATLTATAIRKWKERGVIEACRVNVKGQPLYRVGDVLTRIRTAEGDPS